MRAMAWIAADSRYRVSVNGQRLAWGPAPCDPRQLDVDPVDVTGHLRAGRNVIGVEVLFYGNGDGTWAAGKPGLLVHAVMEMGAGRRETIVTDEQWMTFLDRGHPPGANKRWFLRALQEQFDARLHPAGWDTWEFRPDRAWLPAMPLQCSAAKPVACASGRPYSGDSLDRADPAKSALRMRQIPATRETVVPVTKVAASGRVEWVRPPEDWFESRIPGSFRIRPAEVVSARGEGRWEIAATPSDRDGVYVTFELTEQVVGWPGFTIDAPAGTIVELSVREANDPARNPWLDTFQFQWSRFVCREGVNVFSTFDYESFRFVQLHIRNASRPVTVSSLHARRRTYAWQHVPEVKCGEPALDRLFSASINTIYNSCIETIVDGMARERQQYSGDCGHQLHAVRTGFGDTLLSRRYLRTFSEGLTQAGYFLDCWPGFDRLARVMQREIDGAMWGPLLDHGVGFNFDCWNHYMETGDREALAEPYPRLKRFVRYLESIVDPNGLLPVENIGVPVVWIDHDAYRRTRHKQCAFNLYTAAALRHALAGIARLLGEPEEAQRAENLGTRLLEATVRRYWSASRGTFVANLPWVDEEKELRLCDRSLATSILFDQCPGGQTAAAVRSLAEVPLEMGLSYPANAGWRLWALAKSRRIDVVLSDLRTRWSTMYSVIHNNSLQEGWQASPDTSAQISHCPLAPLFVLIMDIAGIRPMEPGLARCRVMPQFGDLKQLTLTTHTIRGPIRLQAGAATRGHDARIELPPGMEGELVTPDGRQAIPGGRPLAFHVD